MTELKKVFQNKLHNRADFLNLIPFLKLQNVPKSRIHLNTYQRGAYIQGVGVISLGGLVIGSLRCFRLTILENQKLRGSEQVVASLQSNVKDRFCFLVPPYVSSAASNLNKHFSRSFSSTYNDLRTLFGNNFCFVPFVLL